MKEVIRMAKGILYLLMILFIIVADMATLILFVCFVWLVFEKTRPLTNYDLALFIFVCFWLTNSAKYFKHCKRWFNELEFWKD
jgi:hypothetical protein